MPPTEESKSPFERSLVAYALASGAVASSASGAVVYSGSQNLTMSLTVGNSLAIDLDGAASNDFTLRYIDPNPSGASYQLNVVPAANAGVVTHKVFTSAADALSASDSIDSNSVWGGSGASAELAVFDKTNGVASGGWAGLSNRYLGGRIETAPSSGQFIYGWIQLSVPGNALAGGNPASVTVHDWAYETTVNQSILAGQTVSAVPGGGAMTLFSLGASGLGRWRARKRSA